MRPVSLAVLMKLISLYSFLVSSWNSIFWNPSLRFLVFLVLFSVCGNCCNFIALVRHLFLFLPSFFFNIISLRIKLNVVVVQPCLRFLFNFIPLFYHLFGQFYSSGPWPKFSISTPPCPTHLPRSNSSCSPLVCLCARLPLYGRYMRCYAHKETYAYS